MSMLSKSRRWQAGVIASLIVAGIQIPVAAPANAENVATAASMLASKIAAAISGQVNSASAEDLEGQIVLVVTQGTYKNSVVSAALAQMAASASSPALVAAIGAAAKALAKKKGTGAITSDTGSAGQFFSPGAPGGGGSGYTAG